MGEKNSPGYVVELREHEGQYYLSIPELGVIVNDTSLDSAYIRLEKQKKALLEKFAEAGEKPPAPRQILRQDASFSLVGAGVVIAIALAVTVAVWKVVAPVDRLATALTKNIEPALSGETAKMVASVEGVQSVAREIAEHLRKSLYNNYWSKTAGGNGHYYKVALKTGKVSWEEAYLEAKKMGGHLATITNVAENDFVFKLFEGRDEFWTEHGQYRLGPWIGGVKEGGPTEAGPWKWVDGEPVEYANWSPGHPVTGPAKNLDRINFFQGNEWISTQGAYKLKSFVVEFDTLD